MPNEKIEGDTLIITKTFKDWTESGKSLGQYWSCGEAESTGKVVYVGDEQVKFIEAKMSTEELLSINEYVNEQIEKIRQWVKKDSVDFYEQALKEDLERTSASKFPNKTKMIEKQIRYIEKQLTKIPLNRSVQMMEDNRDPYDGVYHGYHLHEPPGGAHSEVIREYIRAELLLEYVNDLKLKLNPSKRDKKKALYKFTDEEVFGPKDLKALVIELKDADDNGKWKGPLLHLNAISYILEEKKHLTNGDKKSVRIHRNEFVESHVLSGASKTNLKRSHTEDMNYINEVEMKIDEIVNSNKRRK